MYELMQGKFAVLKPVTPLTLKVYKKYGYLQAGGFSKEEYDLIVKYVKLGGDEFEKNQVLDILDQKPNVSELEIYMDSDSLKEVVDVTFNYDFELTDEVLIKNVIKGIFDNLGELEPPTLKLPNLLKILEGLKPQTQS